MDNSYPDTTLSSQGEPVTILQGILGKVEFIASRIEQWSTTPPDSVAAGWAPLILEHTRIIQSDLKNALEKLKPPMPPSESSGVPAAGMSLEQVERILIAETLRINNGNRERTAAMLKIGSRTLYRKLNEYGIE